jgi:short-subunit dehydrogenase
MNLSTSRIIVTGSSSGIGKALVERLLSHGATVVGIDRDIPSFSFPRFTSIQADLSQTDAVRSSYNQAKIMLGDVDLYIANAGQARYTSDAALSHDDTELLWNLNVMAVVEALRVMRDDHGDQPYRFVAISSAVAKLPLPGYAFYASTKAAVASYLKGLRFELPANQIIHLVYPVATLTHFFNVSGQTHRSWFAQSPQHVAKSIVNGLQANRLEIYPSFLFWFLNAFFPMALRIYQHRERHCYQTILTQKKTSLP